MKPDQPCLKKDEWEVRPIDLHVAYDLVRLFHYAKSGSNTATFLHGLFRRSDWLNCCGVAWWIPPTKSAAIATWDGDWRRVLSLSRLVITPEVPTNGASFLIGESIRLIREDGRFECLVTYADEWRGHTGNIYRATNWEYLGLTSKETTFVTTDGALVARKAGGHTRTRSEMQSLGHRQIGKFAKHKFRMVLIRGRQKGPTPD
jgi:hypothetical protein